MTDGLTILAPGIVYGDLEFQGRRRIIATALLLGSDGVTIVDPGPSSTLPVLTRLLASVGARVSDVTTLLLTHIHLDHAGSCGVLVRQNPRISVVVHESGARHLVDPTKLLASAGRLYGGAMEQLWGEVLPVPASVMTPVSGRESVAAAGRTIDIAHTPGHASHHVSYFASDAGIAFVGDTAGVQVVPGGFVLPPTPPPDIDLPVWLDSLGTIEQWHPATLFLTHFGPAAGTGVHLAELREHLQLVERFTRDAVASSEDATEREAFFIEHLRHYMRGRMTEADLRDYEVAGRFDLNWKGMARYAAKVSR